MEEPLKCELISEKGGATVSCYTIEGTPFVDFCLGPHIPSTGKIKAIKLLSIAGAHWKGDEKREQMQRIYGTAFFSQEELDEWIRQKEEAERRDHRKVGPELDLFSFSEAIGSGLVLWHPNGAMIRKLIENFLNEELYRRGYDFVYTPTSPSPSSSGSPATSNTTRTSSIRAWSTPRTRPSSTGSSR
jgi:threonyl-tRNA synthetase